MAAAVLPDGRRDTQRRAVPPRGEGSGMATRAKEKGPDEAPPPVPRGPRGKARRALAPPLQYAAAALSFALPVGRWILLSRWAAAEADMRGLGIAVGAGIFEELVFRGVLCFALFRTLRTVIGADRLSAGAIAVVASALLFA